MGYNSKKYDFDMEQGSSFSKKLTFYTDEARTTKEDLTGSTWEMQIRANPGSDVIHTLASPAASGIDIANQANGEITLTISATDTAAFDFEKAEYDLERTNGTIETKSMHGAISLKKEITK